MSEKLERQVQSKVLELHKKEINSKDKVNNSITLLILKHDKDIITLIEEVNNWILAIQTVTVQFVNKEDILESTIKNTDFGEKTY